MTGKKTFLTVQELAALLNLKASWIYDRTTPHGPELIPYLKFGRQVRFDIESNEFRLWLKSHDVFAERGQRTNNLRCVPDSEQFEWCVVCAGTACTEAYPRLGDVLW